VEGTVHIFRDALGLVDLRHPFGERAVHLPVVDFLEGLAIDHVAPDLADQQDHRRRILEGDMDARGRVGGAGPAGHHGDAGTPGQLAVGIRHHGRPALLTAGDETDVAVDQRVQQRQIALPRHAESHLDPMGRQRVRHQLPAGPQLRPVTHRAPSPSWFGPITFSGSKPIRHARGHPRGTGGSRKGPETNGLPQGPILPPQRADRRSST
jgi:hypothetical protein